MEPTSDTPDGAVSRGGIKNRVQSFWDQTPCGTRDLSEQPGTREFFATLARERDEREPFIPDFARFDEQKGRRVLEVGVGAGSDSIRFARAGARFTGVDLTEAAISLTSRRLGLEAYEGDLQTADAENLPFPDHTFDFVYSWGVIHHTPDVPAAAQQLVRVLRPGGRLCVMIYHRHSLVALQCWILNALLRGQPTRSLREVIAGNVESDGTQAFTRSEAADLFEQLEDVRVTPVVTSYDVRYTQNRFLPRWVQQLVPSRFGWFLVIEGRKPLART